MLREICGNVGKRKQFRRLQIELGPSGPRIAADAAPTPALACDPYRPPVGPVVTPRLPRQRGEGDDGRIGLEPGQQLLGLGCWQRLG